MPDPIDSRVYRRLFEEDREGAAVLEELTRRFARGAVTKGGIDAILETYENAGAMKVMNFIVQRINQANGVPQSESDDQ